MLFGRVAPRTMPMNAALGERARQPDSGEGLVGVHRAEGAVKRLADQPKAQRQHVARVLLVVLLNRLLIGRLALRAVVRAAGVPFPRVEVRALREVDAVDGAARF